MVPPQRAHGGHSIEVHVGFGRKGHLPLRIDDDAAIVAAKFGKVSLELLKFIGEVDSTGGSLAQILQTELMKAFDSCVFEDFFEVQEFNLFGAVQRLDCNFANIDKRAGS